MRGGEIKEIWKSKEERFEKAARRDLGVGSGAGEVEWKENNESKS